MHLGQTQIPLSVASARLPSGSFVQLITPSQGITGGQTVRVSVSPGDAAELAVALLDESCADAESAVLYVAQRFGFTVDLHPTLPTTVGSVIEVGEGFTGTPFKAVRDHLGWLRLTDRCPIHPPRRGWELLYLAPEA